jgi:hypothetical protein
MLGGMMGQSLPGLRRGVLGGPWRVVGGGGGVGAKKTKPPRPPRVWSLNHPTRGAPPTLRGDLGGQDYGYGRSLPWGAGEVNVASVGVYDHFGDRQP